MVVLALSCLVSCNSSLNEPESTDAPEVTPTLLNTPAHNDEQLTPDIIPDTNADDVPETIKPTIETPLPTAETPIPTTETPLPTTETHIPTIETFVPSQKDICLECGGIIVFDSAVQATCTESGLTVGTHCSECGKVIIEQKEISAVGHTIVLDKAVPATCVKDGATAGSHCSACDTIFEAQEIIPARHTEVQDAAIAPTCTNCGYTAGSHCSVCGEVIVEQKIIPALGHTVVEQARIEPCCTQDGLTVGKYCEVCGFVIVEQTTIPQKGHKIVTVSAIAATCTETGKTEHKYCSECGEVVQQSSDIKATGHSIATIPQVNPTCQSTGVTEHKYCSKCGLVISTGTAIAKLEHQWSEWQSAPSYKETRSCTLCGKTETKNQKYNPANHTPIETYSGYTDNVKRVIELYHDSVNNWDGHSSILIDYSDFSIEEVGQFIGYLYLHYGFWDFRYVIDLHMYTIQIEVLQPQNYSIVENNRQKLINEVNRILLTFDEGDDFKILQQIADYLADNITYASGYYGSGSALFEHKAVCNGYAMAFKLLAEQAGIKCDFIGGTAVGGGTHAWNAVYVDNQIYYYDITWYDANRSTKYIKSPVAIHTIERINALKMLS